MSVFVLDCSVTASWLFKDEANAAADRLVRELETGRAYVPELWHLEVANVLLQGERRGRISRDDILAKLSLLEGLPIEIEGETGSRALKQILSLARRCGLTTYDAAYLELAISLDLPLATLDKALIRAAADAGVKTIPGAGTA
ncbi:MAG TPA: type II toxin-antitoxin system VapC family toxin [Ensifer sp.]|nr:type II toxin-antitoxin system VapC family toxin [Ensifer sp.]